MLSSVDWAALARVVVPALLGEPHSRNPRDWRWGRKGSLALYLETGKLHDYETGEQLDLLAFLQRHHHLPDRNAASRWLRDHGYLPPLSDSRGPQPKPKPLPETRPGPKPQAADVPFAKGDLQRLDYVAIPNTPDHPLNRWASLKCARPQGAAWPTHCRWLRGWRNGKPAWGGDALLVPLARVDAWLQPGGLQVSDVRGVHAVFVAPDGCPRSLDDGRNKTDWSNTKHYPHRSRSTAGCGVLLGMPEDNRTLAICEGLADALAIHWHLDTPVLAACGSLGELASVADELAWLTAWPRQLHLQIWPDQDVEPNPRTGLRAGPLGALTLCRAMQGFGAVEAQIRIMEYGRPGQDPCDWLAERLRT